MTDKQPQRMQTLSPEESVRRMDECPDEVFFPLSTMCRQLGFTENELKAEMASGRLVVTGSPVPGGYIDLAVSIAALHAWMGDPAAPLALKMRVLEHARRPSILN